jgi:hypothetical protein
MRNNCTPAPLDEQLEEKYGKVGTRTFLPAPVGDTLALIKRIRIAADPSHGLNALTGIYFPMRAMCF